MGRWTSIDHILSSNLLDTSYLNPAPVVAPFIANVIRRLGAMLITLCERGTRRWQREGVASIERIWEEVEGRE